MSKTSYEKKEIKEMKKMIGKTVASVDIDSSNEGKYIIVFTDGSKASFSSIGDDATYTSFCLESK